MTKKRLGIGLIGAGFIGRAHAFGYHTMPVVFAEAGALPVLKVLCESPADRAQKLGAELGFPKTTSDWRDVIADPEVDIVDICAPSNLHREIALAAIAAGKHVYCEKPVGLGGKEATEIAEAARKKGIKTQVGFSYARHPVIGLAKKLIDEGAVGKVIHMRWTYNEDYMADPAAPFTWRNDAKLGSRAGALGDLGAHGLAIAAVLAGEISAVCARTILATPKRKDPATGEMRQVDNEDVTDCLFECSNGVTGLFSTSRIACGSKMHLSFELVGSQGTIRWNAERYNELEYYDSREPKDRQGFRTIFANASHPPYGNFCPAPGHGIGFNDFKVIEIYELMEAIAADKPVLTDMEAGAKVGRIMDAVLDSADKRAWVAVA
jgi:predicted dehydrogenase